VSSSHTGKKTEKVSSFLEGKCKKGKGRGGDITPRNGGATHLAVCCWGDGGKGWSLLGDWEGKKKSPSLAAYWGEHLNYRTRKKG